MNISFVRKRDLGTQKFDEKKITNAIEKALIAVKGKNEQALQKANELKKQTLEILNREYKKKIPSVENVQDAVEQVLIKNNLADVAKAYILYRAKKQEARELKTFLGVKDELKLTANAATVLAKRYLLRDDQGRIKETPMQLFKRTAKAIAIIDKKYNEDWKKTEKEFLEIMTKLEFIPNTPTLMNAGTKLGMLSACFVIPIEDDLRKILHAVETTAIIHQAAGGTGFSFSRLRPKGDIVKSTKGVASGPVSFMRIFDVMTDVIKQGGKRRGANMGILNANHPDIIEFITAKTREKFLQNFNISVAVDKKFMKAVEKDQSYTLINPRTGHAVKKIRAKDIFELIITNAWRTGDPGMIFIDEINQKNPTKSIGKIESTNPCGEQPLHPYESCNLGSINLAKMINNDKVDWKKLRRTVRSGVHFLDNVIDANKYPIKEIRNMTLANRRIGLGVMGWAELLIMLGIKYDSNEALRFGEKLMKFINTEARQMSNELGKKRGSFPNFKKSIWKKKFKATRNATATTVAPTGTISIIAGCSSGIEPLFAISYAREVMAGTRLLEANKYFEETAKKRGFYSKELMARISRTGSVQDFKEIPREVKKLFITTFDMATDWHVKHQAAFQKYTDNAVSKTINLPEDASVDDVRRAYLLAYKLKCKGITIYRYGSKEKQVLYIGRVPGKPEQEQIVAELEYAGGNICVVCNE